MMFSLGNADVRWLVGEPVGHHLFQEAVPTSVLVQKLAMLELVASPEAPKGRITRDEVAHFLAAPRPTAYNYTVEEAGM